MANVRMDEFIGFFTLQMPAESLLKDIRWAETHFIFTKSEEAIYE